jgi:glycosyltransferase involved in cell wall biosynthesis
MNRNKKQVLFSIVVPVYKVENYLDKCVQSLINQTNNNIEIILVNDGSPDSCPAMCDEYAKQDTRIRVVHKTNGGLSDARNAGIEVASGKYIMFVDSDDYIAVNACEKLIPYVEMGADIIVIDGKTIGGKVNVAHINDDKKIYSGTEFLLESLKQNKMPMTSWLYLFKRDFLLDEGLKFKYGILHEDEQFTPRAFLKAKKVANSGVNLYRYFIRENSITTKKDRRKNVEDIYETCCELLELYEHIEDEDLRTNLIDYLVCIYLKKFQDAKAYQYGKKYIHKDFVKANAFLPRTRKKSFLFCFSPRLYWIINDTLAKLQCTERLNNSTRY